MIQPLRLVSVGAFSTWLLLTALTYQQIPGLEYNWAFNLLRYLPDWTGWLLVFLALLVTTEEARRGLVHLGAATDRALQRLPGSLTTDVTLFALVLCALWLLRERDVFASSDVQLTMLTSAQDSLLAPGSGPWVLRGLVKAVASRGSELSTVHLLNCGFGAAAIVCVSRAARTLGDSAAYRVLPVLVFSGGLLRAIGGRVDAQPLFLAAVSLCLLLTLENLRGRGPLWPTALVFGATAILDPLGRFLLPALAALVWQAPAARGKRLQSGALCYALALAPLALPVVPALMAGGHDPGLLTALLGVGEQGFVRRGGPVRQNTIYVLFSAPHWKYLINANLMLAPAALPLLVGFGIARRGHIARTPATRFLAVALASLGVGSFLLRPAFAFYDWDMFAATALFLAFFAGAVLAETESRSLRGQLAAAAVGLQLLFFGLPLSAIAFGAANPAGPLKQGAFPAWEPLEPRRPPGRLAFWL